MLFERGRTCIETAALSHGTIFEKLAPGSIDNQNKSTHRETNLHYSERWKGHEHSSQSSNTNHYDELDQMIVIICIWKIDIGSRHQHSNSNHKVKCVSRL